MILGLDHVQLDIPAGGEPEGRAFYGGTLGLIEIAKPATLAGRGGLWFALADGRELHLGVAGAPQPGELAARRAHLAFALGDEALDALAGRLVAAGAAVVWDVALLPRRRFYGRDPFGNRLEFIAVRGAAG